MRKVLGLCLLFVGGCTIADSQVFTIAANALAIYRIVETLIAGNTQ